jgi:hypothetical protein
MIKEIIFFYFLLIRKLTEFGIGDFSMYFMRNPNNFLFILKWFPISFSEFPFS